MKGFLCTVVILCLCGCSSHKFLVDGRWVLESQTDYLSIAFGEEGYAAVVTGKPNGPLAAPALKWSYKKGVLKVFGESSGTLKELSNLYMSDGKIYGMNSNGTQDVYRYTPPEKLKSKATKRSR